MALRIPEYVAVRTLAGRVGKSSRGLSEWIRRYNGQNPEAKIRRVHGAVVVVDFERAWSEAGTQATGKALIDKTLTAAEIRELRGLYEQGATTAVMQERFGVTLARLGHYARRHGWERLVPVSFDKVRRRMNPSGGVSLRRLLGCVDQAIVDVFGDQQDTVYRRRLFVYTSVVGADRKVDEVSRGAGVSPSLIYADVAWCREAGRVEDCQRVMRQALVLARGGVE